MSWLVYFFHNLFLVKDEKVNILLADKSLSFMV
jgi:hypothetical protein